MEKLTCRDRDTIFGNGSSWEVYSSLTDNWGTWGEPVVDTTWCRSQERLRDVRHPDEQDPFGTSDRKPCEHYYWVELGEDDRE